MSKSLTKWITVELFFSLNVITVFSYAILSQDISRTLSLSDANLGTLGGVFFIAYAAAQLVFGALFGRVSAKLLLSITAIISAIGTGLFGYSESLTTAIIARICMGIGFSTAFVGVVYIVGREFKDSFAFMTALSQSSCNFLGALVGIVAAFIPFLTEFRLPFKVLGVLILINGLLMLFVIDEAVDKDSKKTGQRDGFWDTALTALKSPQVWVCSVYFSGLFGTFLAYADIWNVVFQVRTFGLSETEASMINSSLPVGLTIGGLISGWWANKTGFILPSRIFSWAGFILLAVLYFKPVDEAFAALVMFSVGFALSASAIGLAALPLHLPASAVSMGTSIVLTIAFMYGGVLGSLVGNALEGSNLSDFSTYQKALTVLLLSVLISAIASLLFRPSKKAL